MRTHQCKHHQLIGKETEVQRSKLAQFETIAELKLGCRFGPVIKRFCMEEELIEKPKTLGIMFILMKLNLSDTQLMKLAIADVLVLCVDSCKLISAVSREIYSVHLGDPSY